VIRRAACRNVRHRQPERSTHEVDHLASPRRRHIYGGSPPAASLCQASDRRRPCGAAGPHAGYAHRRLAFLAAAFEPPSSFAVMAYAAAASEGDHLCPAAGTCVRRSGIRFRTTTRGTTHFPGAATAGIRGTRTATSAVGIFALPMPVYRPVPVWVRPPEYVAPPPNNVIYENVHNTVVVNNVTNTVTVTNQAGQTTTIQPPAPAAGPAQAGQAGTPTAPAPVAAIGPALPPSVARRPSLCKIRVREVQARHRAGRIE
jgi:hypothetical protein